MLEITGAHQRDHLAIEADSGYIPRALRADVDIPRNTRTKWHNEARSLTRPTKNGYNDPLTHLLLVDALLRLTPHQLVRAGNLRDLLRVRSPQIMWDSVTIGRILSELTAIGPKHIETGRDRFGTYFTINHESATYKWLASLRANLSARMAEEIDIISKGNEPPARTFSVWEGAVA